MVKSYILGLCSLRTFASTSPPTLKQMSDAQMEQYFTVVKPLPKFMTACDDSEVESLYAQDPFKALLMVYRKHPEFRPATK